MCEIFFGFYACKSSLNEQVAYKRGGRAKKMAPGSNYCQHGCLVKIKVLGEHRHELLTIICESSSQKSHYKQKEVYDISAFRESKMAKRSLPLHVRYRLQTAWSTVVKKEALTSRIPQVRQLLRPPGSCLIDNATLLNSMMYYAVERELTQLPAPAQSSCA